MISITHGRLTHPLNLDYPANTRTTQYRVRDPGGGRPYEDWQVFIDNARREFIREHEADIRRELGEPGDTLDLAEELFITIAFTTFEILIEVSDRLIRSGSTHVGTR